MNKGSVVLIALLISSVAAAEARGFGFRGGRGAVGGFQSNVGGKSYGLGARYAGRAAGLTGGSFQTPAGGAFKGAAAGFVGPNAGALGGGWKGTTAAGGAYQGAGGAAWLRGVGGVEGTHSSINAANGASYAGYTKGRYNAQSGQGTYDSGKTFTSASGQQYGYDQSTEFTRGKGGETTLDTRNNGDYQIDWQKGQKPVVTEIGAPQPVSVQPVQ